MEWLRLCYLESGHENWVASGWEVEVGGLTRGVVTGGR
jgi:hypothetical protein